MYWNGPINVPKLSTLCAEVFFDVYEVVLYPCTKMVMYQTGPTPFYKYYSLWVVKKERLGNQSTIDVDKKKSAVI